MPTSLKDCLTQEEKVEFLKQEQIKKSQNFQPVGEQAEELEKQAQEEAEINKIQPTPEQLTEWKRTGIINDFQGKNLDFSKLVDRTGWNSKLIIKNCLELKYIDVSDLGLKIFNVLNCSELKELNATNNNIDKVRFYRLNKLETIYLNNNKLTNFDASILPNIKNLDVSANKLTGLDLKECKQLETLNCGINHLTKLDLNDCHNLKNLLCYSNNFSVNGLQVNQLEHLKYLACQNSAVYDLDVSDLKNLKEVLCFGKATLGMEQPNFFLALTEINVKGCESLEVLDIGEGLLIELELENHLNLEIVSVKQNSLVNLNVNNCPRLNYLDYSMQGDWKVKSESNRIKPLLISHYSTDTLINNSRNLEQLYFTKKAIFYNLEGEKISQEEFQKQFPKLSVFKCHEKANPAFDKAIDKRETRKAKEKQERARGNKPTDSGYSSETEEQKKKKNEEEPVINDPNRLENNYPYFLDVYGEESEITVTNEGLTETLIIDGYQGQKINVGNNFLSYLQIKNCPNLTTLRYAYNAMKHDAFIDWDTCRNLREENINKYDYDNPNWPNELKDIPFDQSKSKGKEEFNKRLKQKKNLLARRKKINEQVKSLLTKLEKGETDAFQEFINAFQGQDFEFVFADLNEGNQAQFTKIFVPKLEARVQELIKNHKQDKSYFLNEVEKILPFQAYLSEELKNQLTSLIQSEINPPKTNYWPLIGLGTIALISLGIMFWLANKKKFLTIPKFPRTSTKKVRSK